MHIQNHGKCSNENVVNYEFSVDLILTLCITN